jgi:SM-20-related protein
MGTVFKFSENDICVVDEVVTAEEQQRIGCLLKSSIWRFGWPINDAYFSRPCWHSFIVGSRRVERQSSEDELRSHPEWAVLHDIWMRVKAIHMPQATLLGVYANGQTFGQDSPIHRDNRPSETGKTVVLFCNEHWATCWGGELVFYDHQKQYIIKSILPKPGRAVIFNGHVPHSARSPAVNCDQLRVTIAFKTVL